MTPKTVYVILDENRQTVVDETKQETTKEAQDFFDASKPGWRERYDLFVKVWGQSIC